MLTRLVIPIAFKSKTVRQESALHKGYIVESFGIISSKSAQFENLKRCGHEAKMSTLPLLFVC